jgi:hypothetical protein
METMKVVLLGGRTRRDGQANTGGLNSHTSAKGGGISSLGQHPTWAFALCVQMARL